MEKSIKNFISYSHKDDEYKEQLLTFLAPLRNDPNISQWNDHEILPGEEWDKEIKEAFHGFLKNKCIH